MFHTFHLLLVREFTIERRTFAWLGSMGMLGLVSVIVLGLGFFPEAQGDTKTALTIAGLWLIVLFCGSVGVSRAFAQERESGALDGLKLLPLDPAVLYLAKVVSGICSMLVALAALLCAAAFFTDAAIREHGLKLAPVFALASLGYIATGTLVSTMTSTVRGRDALLALVLFPIVVPLFVLATGASRDLLLGATIADTGDELAMLAAFDAIYLALGMLTFGRILES